MSDPTQHAGASTGATTSAPAKRIEPACSQGHASASAPAKRPRPARSQEHGVAVLIVIACLAILVPFSATFNFRARVDWQSAINTRDEVAARNLQRGAMRLSLLLFELQRMVFNQRQFRDMVGNMDVTQVAPYLMSVFGTVDGAEGLGALVGLDASALSDLALQNGSFEVRLEAESGKLNVNCLAEQKGEQSSAAIVAQTLEALMAPTLFNPLFEEEKGDGQRYTRDMIVQALADYVDEDSDRFDIYTFAGGGGKENYRYQQLFDAYQPRDARMDSIDEIQLVEGIDDDWMAAFGAQVTVYGGCKVNLNFASAEQIALVIKHAVSADDRWKTEGDNFLIKTMPLATFVVQSREFSLFRDINAFRDLVAKPDQFVNPLTMLGGGDATDVQSTLPRVPEGIDVRSKPSPPDAETKWGGVSEVATVAPERIYRLEVITNVGAVKKRLVAIYDMQYPRAQTQGKGAWLYYRED